MEWLMQLQGQVVGLDTAPLIYLMEQNQAYLGLVRAFFGALSRGEFQVVTSTLTLTEVLVHPLRSGNVELAGQYRDILLDQENLITVPISVEIAEVAAQLRARQKQDLLDRQMAELAAIKADQKRARQGPAAGGERHQLQQGSTRGGPEVDHAEEAARLVRTSRTSILRNPRGYPETKYKAPMSEQHRGYSPSFER